jgi:hypothetical protein
MFKPTENSEELFKLLEEARKAKPMTAEERRVQRVSFAYGNLALHDEKITKEMVEAADRELHPEAYKQFADCHEAWAQLDANFVDDRGIIRRKDLAYLPTLDDYGAIDHLCDEWDYQWDAFEDKRFHRVRNLIPWSIL